MPVMPFDSGTVCSTDSVVASGDGDGWPLHAEVVAHASVDESFHVGCCNLKEVLRPTLADLRVITGPPEDGAQARRRLHDRPACHPKFEPWMDLDEVRLEGSQAHMEYTFLKVKCHDKLSMVYVAMGLSKVGRAGPLAASLSRGAA